MKKFILINFLFFFALSSCKKYDEDKGFQWRTVKNRIVGDWRLDRYFVEGVERDNTLISFDFEVRKNLHFLANIYVSPEYENDYNGIFQKPDSYQFYYGYSINGLIAGENKELFFLGTNSTSLVFKIKSLSKDKRMIIENESTAERFEFIPMNR